MSFLLDWPVIKYALLGDVEFLTWLEQHMEALVAGDATLLAEAVYRSCAQHGL